MATITKTGARTVSAQIKGQPEITDETILGSKTFETQPCLRTLGISYTLNLGNYESMRVSSEVTIPVRKEDLEASIDECYAHVKEGLDYITMKGFEMRGRKA